MSGWPYASQLFTHAAYLQPMRHLTLLSLSILLIASCGSSGNEAALKGRIRNLEDSLSAYRDSVHHLRHLWSFNTISPVVKVYPQAFLLGDSCYADVFISARNTADNGYRYHRPIMTAAIASAKGTKLHITDMNGWWRIAFKPKRAGEDSIMGRVYLPCNGCTDTTTLHFMSKFKAVIPPEPLPPSANWDRIHGKVGGK